MATLKDATVEGFTIEANTDPLPTRRIPFSVELADRLYAVARANINGACNGTVYASNEDETFKEHSSVFRRALQSRLDNDTERARIVELPQGEEQGAPIKFAVVIRAYNPRGPRNVEDTETEDEGKSEDADTE